MEDSTPGFKVYVQPGRFLPAQLKHSKDWLSWKHIMKDQDLEWKTQHLTPHARKPRASRSAEQRLKKLLESTLVATQLTAVAPRRVPVPSKKRPIETCSSVLPEEKKRKKDKTAQTSQKKSNSNNSSKPQKSHKAKKPRRTFLFRIGIVRPDGKELCAVCHRKGRFTVKWITPPANAPSVKNLSLVALDV